MELLTIIFIAFIVCIVLCILIMSIHYTLKPSLVRSSLVKSGEYIWNIANKLDEDKVYCLAIKNKGDRNKYIVIAYDVKDNVGFVELKNSMMEKFVNAKNKVYLLIEKDNLEYKVINSRKAKVSVSAREAIKEKENRERKRQRDFAQSMIKAEEKTTGTKKQQPKPFDYKEDVKPEPVKEIVREVVRVIEEEPKPIVEEVKQIEYIEKPVETKVVKKVIINQNKAEEERRLKALEEERKLISRQIKAEEERINQEWADRKAQEEQRKLLADQKRLEEEKRKLQFEESFNDEEKQRELILEQLKSEQKYYSSLGYSEVIELVKISEIYGIGPKTSKYLNEFKIFNIGDLVNVDSHKLKEIIIKLPGLKSESVNKKAIRFDSFIDKAKVKIKEIIDNGGVIKTLSVKEK